MIDLRFCCDNIPEVAEEWAKSLHDFLFEERKDKLGRKHASYYDKKEKQADNNQKTELTYFKKCFREIVLADEKGLEYYSKKNVSEYMKTFMIDLYKAFTQDKQDKNNEISNAHYFFHQLNIRTCPYCNRHYTFTLSKKNTKVSPEYDHFYDKSSHPLLAVSFYNLVPSCHTCNHVKGTKDTAKINPYFSGFKSKFMLHDEKGDKLIVDYDKVSMKERRNDYGKLTYSGLTEEERGNVQTFGLQGLYEMHDDYIKELLDKVVAYNPTVRQALVDAFQDQAYSPQQVYDFVWGRYLDEAQYQRRPLSKLTKDILEQLGILPDNDFH